MLLLFILCAALTVQRPYYAASTNKHNTNINKAGNVIIEVTLRYLRATISSVEKQ
jgi:hypothetical protein